MQKKKPLPAFPRFLLFLLCLLSGFSLRAQPVITDAAMVKLGESAPVQFALGSFNPGPDGANVSWDYSSLADDTLAFTWTAVDPSTTPFVDSFPNANLAFLAPGQGGGQDNWIYYDWNPGAGTLDLHGSAAVLNGTSSQDTFYYVLTPDPKRVQTFPFAMNDTYTDGFAGRNHISVNNFGIMQTRSGTITTEADAYGSLVTPAGSFQNVLRIHQVEQITDLYMGFPTNQTIHRYSWYSSDEKYLLLHMDSIVLQPMGGPAQTTISIFYRAGAPTVGLDDAAVADPFELQLYPNPTSGNVSLRFVAPGSEALHLGLRDLSGRQVMADKLVPGAGISQYQLDLQSYPAGLYLLDLQQGADRITRKIILQ